MNILFILYGDFTTNTSNPIALFCEELTKLGHTCAVAVPFGVETSCLHEFKSFLPLSFDEIFKSGGRVFPNDAMADVIHASTPRINIEEFLKNYLSRWPTPLIIYLEDNEYWISKDYLGLDDDALLSLTNSEIRELLPDCLSHPFEYCDLIILADSIILIQDKLMEDVPSFIQSRVIPWGVDQSKFSPSIKPSEKWSQYFNLIDDDNVIVYHGGINGFTHGPILDLCKAIEILNKSGISCKLIRTGINPINFWEELSPDAKAYIFDAGVINKDELPSLLALADLYVQPGRITPFEDLRMPSKLVEFFSMGKPVVLPNVNIASMLKDDFDALILQTGEPDEIANLCQKIFSNQAMGNKLGLNGRRFAEKHFNLRVQALKMELVLRDAIAKFDKSLSKDVWETARTKGIAFASIHKLEIMLNLNAYNCQEVTRYLLTRIHLQLERNFRHDMRHQGPGLLESSEEVRNRNLNFRGKLLQLQSWFMKMFHL